MNTLKIEHDRLENFIKNYAGKLSLNYEIDRLRDLKNMLSKGENAMEKLIEACKVNNWDFEKVEKDFILFCEYAEMDLEEALEEYIEETLNQGYEG